jgi:type I restriction enzyme S subunit
MRDLPAQQAAVPGALPSDWATVPMDSIASFVRGLTYKKSDARAAPTHGYVPLVRATNLQDDRLLLEDFVFVPRELVKDEQCLRPNDIVVATSSGSSSVVGKSAQVLDDFDGTFGAFCAALRPGPAVVPLYLRHFVQSPATRRDWSRAARGVNINNLKREHLLATTVTLPPLPEQQRIVEILEEQLSRLDAALDSVRVVREKAAQFRRSLLHAAFTGGLAERNRDGSPSSASPRTIPLSEALLSIRNGVTYQNAPDSGGLPIARIQTIANGEIDFAKVGYAGLAEADPRHLLEPGDILFSHINSQSHVGKVAIYGPGMPRLVHGMNLLRLRPRDSVRPMYLFYALQCPDVRHQIWASTRHAVNQASINIRTLSQVSVPSPPLAEQQRIVEVLDEQLSRLDASLAVADQIEKRSAALRRSLLHAAFTGRLTEQWREHAHV